MYVYDDIWGQMLDLKKKQVHAVQKVSLEFNLNAFP